MSRAPTRAFRDATGVTWAVSTRAPGASNVMMVFLHPDRTTTARDRYAWWVTAGPEARDVTARLNGDRILSELTDVQLAGLFRRSMPISSDVPRFAPG